MKQLFTANLNNEVVAFASTLEDFVRIVNDLLPTAQHYSIDDFHQKFEENSIWLLRASDDEVYNFQEVY